MNTEMTPHQRLATVDDIASTVAFLCSEGGSFINGQTIVVDGGWSSTKYLSEFALTSEWVRALNLFALLDQAAARFGDRGAVYCGERQLCTWRELRDRALRLATSVRQIAGPGARIAIASENRPEIVELMFAIWAAECAVVPINCKLHPREMAQILEDAERRRRCSPRRRSLRNSRPLPIFRSKRLAQKRIHSGWRPNSHTPPIHRSVDAGLALLHQRHHRPIEGRDAVAPQPDGDDGRPSRGHRCARRELQSGARRADVAWLGPLHRSLRAARRPPGGAGIGPHSIRAEFLDLCEHHPGSSAFLAPTMVQRLVETGR